MFMVKCLVGLIEVSEFDSKPANSIANKLLAKHTFNYLDIENSGKAFNTNGH